MTILRQINCLLSSEALLQTRDKEKILQKFALLIASTENPNMFKTISGAFLPGLVVNNGLSNNDIIYTPYYYLLDNAKKIDFNNRELFFLLYNYLEKIKDRSELNRILTDIFSNEAKGISLNITGIISRYGTDAQGNARIRLMPRYSSDIESIEVLEPLQNSSLATTGQSILQSLFLGIAVIMLFTKMLRKKIAL